MIMEEETGKGKIEKENKGKSESEGKEEKIQCK
jgi:hypothetical protein